MVGWRLCTVGRLQLHWERATKAIHQIPRSKTPLDGQASVSGCGRLMGCCDVGLLGMIVVVGLAAAGKHNDPSSAAIAKLEINEGLFGTRDGGYRQRCRGLSRWLSWPQTTPAPPRSER